MMEYARPQGNLSMAKYGVTEKTKEKYYIMWNDVLKTK